MKKHINLISIIMLLLIIIISGTYAFYNARINKTGNNITIVTTKKLSLNFQDGPEIVLNNILPGQKIIKKFSVTNTGSITQTYHLEFIDVINELDRTEDLVYTLASTNDGKALDEMIFPEDNESFATDITIGAGVTQEYTMIIEYKNLNENQSIDMNKKVSAKIQLTDKKNTALRGSSIHDILSKKKGLSSGYYEFEVTTNDETVTYPVHVITLDGNQTVTGDTMYGDADDVASGAEVTEMAKNTVILKVNGDYTVNDGVTVSPYHNEFGGPKGFLLYVTGTLTNNGTIDNSYGAYATGDNVYLYNNTNNSYEYIPAVGGAGGAGLHEESANASKKGVSGSDGNTVTSRALAGGGSGGLYNGDESPKSNSGAGGAATSYSGGAGGGAIDQNSYDLLSAQDATGTGLGGNAYGYRAKSGWMTRYASGGAGAINGLGSKNGELSTEGQGVSGSGGLLVIFANSIVNTGTFTAKGHTATVWGNAQGGSSGGGSINIFSNETISRDSIITACDVSGGTSNITSAGGDGGTGTINVGQIRNGQYYDADYIDQSLFAILNNYDIPSGNYDFKVIANHDRVIYPVHLIVLNGNQVITEDTQYGSLSDCATGTADNQMAKRMVIVKVNGDYTINSGVTVGPIYHEQYGGPKGFMLYVTGTLTNNGTIDNSHGAYAVGDDVYLWKNSQTANYEMIPAVGGTGAPAVYNNSKNKFIVGIAGTNGSLVDTRALGGGGSGGTSNGDATGVPKSYSGAGGSATSYSGGAGGGGIDINVGGTRSATAATNYGMGGDGYGYRASSNWANRSASGGAGNPNGRGCLNESYNTDGQGTGGTGGLLIIYANSINNSGLFTANGYTAVEYGRAQGGSSGGGSINIFANTITGIDSTSCEANGGHSTWTYGSGSETGTGGDGGNGTINVGSIIDNQYVTLNLN